MQQPWIAALVACLATSLTPAAGAAQDTTKVTSHVPAAALKGKPHPILLGADVSALDAPMRRPGFHFPPYQKNGKPSDEVSILERHGWKAYRLRVFVSPVRQAPDNSLENTLPLAKKIKASGGLFLLDIHYSDTWADPQHQEIPVAWRSLDFDGLEKQVERYSRETIEAFRKAGAMPDWVQVGNEITRGTLWPLAQVNAPGQTQYLAPAPYDSVRQWEHLTRILKAGVRGVREGAAGARPPRIVIHIDRGGDWATTKWFFDHLEAAHVPYDIIGQSYYPPWRHGTMEELWQNMNESAARYHKDFAVVETGYERSHSENNPDMLWPVTPEGRAQFITDLVTTVQRAPRTLTVMYWQPEWDLWNPDGTPGPTVFVGDKVKTPSGSAAVRRSAPVRR